MSSPASFDLCQLSDVKAWLTIATNQSADDNLLSRLITAVSYDFLREIARLDFTPAQDYTEVREGDGGDLMVLRHWPLNSVSSVTITVPNASPPIVNVPKSTDDVMNGYWIDMDIDPERRWELYLDGFVFTDLATITVMHNAGYQTAPQDVEQAVIDWVAYRYKTRQWIGQTSKHMAQGETIQTPESEIPASVKRVIERYRRYDPPETVRKHLLSGMTHVRTSPYYPPIERKNRTLAQIAKRRVHPAGNAAVAGGCAAAGGGLRGALQRCPP